MLDRRDGLLPYWYPTAFSLWGEEEHEAIRRVVASGRFTMGPETEAFEAELAEHNHRKHAVCVNSGSSANMVAVTAMLGGRLANVVAVPALAWATTYSPFMRRDMDVLKLVDCDDSWNADWSRRPVTFPDVLVGCSILGNPADLRVIEAMQQRTNSTPGRECWFLNDNCESLGARLDGTPLGKFGDVATLSFFYSHQVSAVEGGCVLTDDDALARRCRMLRDHGMTRGVEPPTEFDDEYKFMLPGFNVRPVEMHSAVGREQLRKIVPHATARRENWRTFFELAKGLPIKPPRITDVTGFNPFGIHFALASQGDRWRLAKALREAGVDCRLPTGGSFRLHPYGFECRDQLTPNADSIHRTGMFIGNAPFDISEKIARAVRVMKAVLE